MIDELRHQLQQAADVDVPVDAVAAMAAGQERLRRGTRRRRVAVVGGVGLVAAGAVVIAQAHGGRSTAVIAAERSPAVGGVAGHVVIPKLHLSTDVRDGIGPHTLARGLAASSGLDLCSGRSGVVFGWADQGPKPFNSLGRLAVGDPVTFTTPAQRCTFFVKATRLVAPTVADVTGGHTVLVARWPKGHDLDPSSRRLVVTLSAPGEPTPRPVLPPSIELPSLHVLQVLVRRSFSVEGVDAGADGPLVEGVPLCTRGTVVIYGHRTTYGHPFNGLDQLKPGAPVVLRSPTRSCTLPVVSVSVMSPQAAARLHGHTYLVTQTPKYSAVSRLVVQLRDP